VSVFLLASFDDVKAAAAAATAAIAESSEAVTAEAPKPATV